MGASVASKDARPSPVATGKHRSQDKGLALDVIADRNTASRLGVAARDIDTVLYDAFGQRLVSTIYERLNQYHVVMEAAPQYQRTPETLQSVFVRSASGKMMPLAAFARFGPSNTSWAVNHQGQWPAVTISFNLAPGVSLGQATQAIQDVERTIRFPETIHASFQGTAAAFQDSLANEPILIATALSAVYIVLGMLYESFIHPITILSTIPSAGVGALLALKITHNELNVIGLIGIILLIGLVKKSAIMMIDFALDAERREGKSPLDAIYEACVAALLGGLPLALASGDKYLDRWADTAIKRRVREKAWQNYEGMLADLLASLRESVTRYKDQGVNSRRRSLVASEFSAP